jgi:hypothetical protein
MLRLFRVSPLSILSIDGREALLAEQIFTFREQPQTFWCSGHWRHASLGFAIGSRSKAGKAILRLIAVIVPVIPFMGIAGH